MGLVSGSNLAVAKCVVSIPTDEGPLYPEEAIGWGSDLTRVAGVSGRAQGEIAIVYGQLIDAACQPLADTVVDIWQADPLGRYKHPRDRSSGERWEDFLYWGESWTSVEGNFEFLFFI